LYPIIGLKALPTTVYPGQNNGITKIAVRRLKPVYNLDLANVVSEEDMDFLDSTLYHYILAKVICVIGFQVAVRPPALLCRERRRPPPDRSSSSTTTHEAAAAVAAGRTLRPAAAWTQPPPVRNVEGACGEPC